VILQFVMQSTLNNSSPKTNPDGNKAKCWTFTIINPNDAHISKFEDLKEFTTYWIYGKETCPTTGTLHLQCYLVGKKQITKPTMRKWFGDGGNFYAVSLGTPQENKVYCSKDNDFTEWGNLPEARNVAGGEATKQKWTQIVKLSKEKDHDGIMKEHPKEFLVHYKNIKQIGFDFSDTPSDLDAPCGEWIWGPTGVGKSTTARRENPGAFIKPMNKWWDNYKGQDVVILEDMSPSFSASMEYFMKIWPDCFAFPAEIKNHTVQLRPKKFIVTSQYHPKAIWQKEAYDAIIRRFKIREMMRIENKSIISIKSNPKQKIKKHDKPFMKQKAPKKVNKEGKVVNNTTTQPKFDYLSNPKDVIAFNEAKAKFLEKNAVLTKDKFILTVDEAKERLGPIPIDWNKVHMDSPDAQNMDKLIDCAEIDAIDTNGMSEDVADSESDTDISDYDSINDTSDSSEY